MHGIRTIILQIFRYREIASWTKFDACCCHTEEKSAKSLTVVNRYRIKTLTGTKNLPPPSCEFLQSKKLVLHQESPLLQNRSFLTSDFKNLKSVGEP
jgi:hypothetical protein